MTDGAEARAAAASARATPLLIALGTEEFRFLPEMPLDVLLGLDVLHVDSTLEARIWVEAHILVGCECDTSCAEDGLPLLARECGDELALRRRLKKVRNEDGSRVSGDAFDNFHAELLGRFAVTEGESGSSGESPATPGDSSSGTASGTA